MNEDKLRLAASRNCNRASREH